MTSPATAAIAGAHRSRPRFASWIGCGLLLSALAAGCAPTMPEPGEWNSFAEKKAQARFKELCDTQAGEHIYKTVDNVEGYLWVSAWPDIGDLWSPEHIRQLNDQYGLINPFDYCDTCLIGFAGLLGSPNQGYSYVEFKHVDGRIDVRTGPPSLKSRLPRPHAVDQSRSRYVVSFEPIGSVADRVLWIGGGHLKIHDVKTGELLAERLGFVRGNPGLQRLSATTGPWAQVFRCQAAPASYVDFTVRVLRPVSGGNDGSK